MPKIKDIILENRRFMFGIFVHVILTWSSLAISYGSYKEYVRMVTNTFPASLKTDIKATFPWATLIFIALYVIYGIMINKRYKYPTIRHYTILVVFYAIIINIAFYMKESSILFVLNFSIVCLIILLFAMGAVKKFIVIDTAEWAEEIIPASLYRSLQRGLPTVREYFKHRTLSEICILGFLLSIIFSALSLMAGEEKASIDLANIAYFLLLFGVLIEIYRLVKYREKNKLE